MVKFELEYRNKAKTINSSWQLRIIKFPTKVTKSLSYHYLNSPMTKILSIETFMKEVKPVDTENFFSNLGKNRHW